MSRPISFTQWAKRLTQSMALNCADRRWLALAAAAVSPVTSTVQTALGSVLGSAGSLLGSSPAGTVVTVALHAATARDGAMLTVSDDGPGIPAALRERMTARFERLDRKSEGLGLGLAICRQIADVHGATLVVEAGADGRGLSVSLRFPAA